MAIKLTWQTIVFILLVILIFYLKFRVGVDHFAGPESVIELFK